MEEINECLEGEKDDPELGWILGQCDWLWELHLLLYEDAKND